MPEPSRGATQPGAALRVELDYAEMALRTGDADAALRSATRVVAASAASPDLRWAARHVEGLALEALGHLAPAIAALVEVVARPPEPPEARGGDGVASLEDDRRAWIAAVLALSRCLRVAGRLPDATAVGDRARPRILAWGMESGTEAIKLQVTVASAYHQRGDLNHATRLCLGALEVAEARHDDEARASALWNTGMLESARGHHDVALHLLEQALTLLAAGADARGIGRLRTQVAWLLLRQLPPRPTAALELLAQAGQDLRHSSASVLDRAVHRLARVHALLALGRTREARTAVARLLELVGDLVAATADDAHADLLAEAHLVAAELACAQGRTQEQWSHLHLAREAATRSTRTAVATTAEGAPATPGHPGDRSAGELWLALATVSERFGDLHGAVTAHRTASRLLGRGYALVRPASVVR